jgi:hypothetical protein
MSTEVLTISDVTEETKQLLSIEINTEEQHDLEQPHLTLKEEQQ